MYNYSKSKASETIQFLKMYDDNAWIDFASRSHEKVQILVNNNIKAFFNLNTVTEETH